MIKDLHNKLVNKEITAVELAEQYFDVIEKKDGEIGAFLTLTKELAMKQAKMVDEKISRGEEIGIIEGIPGGVKDLICVDGARATGGSKILDNYIAPYDATVIRKLKEAGAVILGKTNCDEFAMGSSTENSAYGPTKNPIDFERVSGGTSGGSAAAVAADMAPWTLGTDTGGSSRQPASFCGVVGLKPTYGRVSRYGVMAAASSLEQVGVITKTSEDAAIVLSVISGEDKMDATCAKSPAKDYTRYLTENVKGVKIGIVKEHFEGLSEDIKKLINDAIEKYKKLGVNVVEIELPNTKYALPSYYIINFSEISSNLARFDGIKYGMSINDQKDTDFEINTENRKLLETYLDTRKYGFGDEVKRRIMLGTYALSAGYYDAYYKKAQKVRALIRDDFEKAFEKVDFIFSPTAPEAAFKLGAKTDDPMKMYLSDIYTITANLAGVPAISFPIGTISEDGKQLPIGGQLMGRWFDEEGLLNAAYTFEINK